MNWKLHEKLCLDYLSATYTLNNIRFESEGGSDSTVPDIAFFKENHLEFYIETKKSNAQSGQCVVSLKDGLYTLSDGNQNYNPFSDQILDHLNHNHITACTGFSIIHP